MVEGDGGQNLVKQVVDRIWENKRISLRFKKKFTETMCRVLKDRIEREKERMASNLPR
jgi:hypothetical protein